VRELRQGVYSLLTRHKKLFHVANIARTSLVVARLLPAIVNNLGLSHALWTIAKALVVKNREDWTRLSLAVCNAKVLDREHVSWRGYVLHVPQNLLNDFADVLFELCAGTYKFLGTYDVVIDIGGFLGETALWLITEGIAKRVVVFEPVYYEVCRQNLAALQGVEVYPYSVYKERAKVKLVIAGKNSAVSNYGIEVEAVTFNEVLEKASGEAAVKIDCEGCEQYLIDVSCEMLRRAREYIIEVHPGVDRQALIKTFTSCGFQAEARPVMLHFLQRP